MRKYDLVDGSNKVLGHSDDTNDAVVYAQSLADTAGTSVYIWNKWNDEIFGVVSPQK